MDDQSMEKVSSILEEALRLAIHRMDSELCVFAESLGPYLTHIAPVLITNPKPSYHFSLQNLLGTRSCSLRKVSFAFLTTPVPLVSPQDNS